MNCVRAGVVIAAVVCASLGMAVAAEVPAGPVPVVHTEDVARFFKVYDAAGGHPSAEQLQHDYLDAGSDGLHRFAQLRDVSGARIAQAIAEHPDTYASAKRCMAVLPRVRERISGVLSDFKILYPETKLVSVTIAVGRGKPVGVTSGADGLIVIGLEALCATDWLSANVEERFVHVIAHEYVHVQQVPAIVDDAHPTVLEASLMEGGAEFVGELISGDVAYPQFSAWTKGREKEIESGFVADQDSRDLSRWLYNGKGTAERMGDLGYWVGYRVARSYFEHAHNKRQALHDIIRMTDAKALLAKSGWYPGIPLAQ